MAEALIIDAVRTPMGRYRGALAGVRPDDLAAHAIAAAVARTGIDPAQVGDVYWGAANQAGEDNRDVARMASLLAGLPVEVPGVTVNRLCASGLEAVNQASRALRLGEGELYLAGGSESMSRAPWVVPKPAAALPRGEQTMYDTALGWRLINPRMAELYSTEAMGETAENVAERHSISREDQDEFALASHRRAIAARDERRFAEQIVAIEAPEGRTTTLVEDDEGGPIPRSSASPRCARRFARGAASPRVIPRRSTMALPASSSHPSARRRSSGPSRSRGWSPRASRGSTRASWGSVRCPRSGARSMPPGWSSTRST